MQMQLAIMAAALAGAAAAQEVRPNFVFILADDLGWGDLGCYGNGQIKTPQLDRLARQGTLFTQFYVNGSVCSPSRCAFFTGQYPARHRIHGHFAAHDVNARRGMPDRLEPSVPNVARLLQSAGYATAHIGKWHLSDNRGDQAIGKYGFDFVGATETGGPDGPSNDPYYRARSTERFVDQSLEFLEANKSKPFYLQLWTLVPHALLRPTDEQMKPYERWHPGSGKSFPHRSAAEIYYASVTDLDTQIGRLLAGLERLGLANNTVVFFSSDNGPEDIHVLNAGHSGIGSAGPFRGRKRSLYEGGVRVPGIVRWPGRTPAGRVDETSVVAGVDWLPTVCNLAQVSIPKAHSLDGECAADIWQGTARPRRTTLFWEWRFRIAGEPFHHSPELAIREGHWKLLLNPDRSRVELYDMNKDLLQLDNVAGRHPDVAARLGAQALAWAKELPAGPRDPGAGQLILPGPQRTRPAKRAAAK